MPRILLIDDDAHLAAPLATYFARFDFALEQRRAAERRAGEAAGRRTSTLRSWT